MEGRMRTEYTLMYNHRLNSMICPETALASGIQIERGGKGAGKLCPSYKVLRTVGPI